MFIKNDMDRDDIVVVNNSVLNDAVKLINSVLSRVTYDNSDILHKPSVNHIDEYYENVSVIISDKIKNKFLK